MFTGIVEEVGKIYKIYQKPMRLGIDIEADQVIQGTKIGDSIAVDGVCLTVVQINKNILSFEAIPETIRATTLSGLALGQKVNLERALKVGDRLGGHFVTGHVDGTGVIRSKKLTKGNVEFVIGVPPSFLKYLLPKGSVAVDGISLTVVRVARGSFSVYIIPHTVQVTSIGSKHSGHKVNIELDILTKQTP